MTTERLEFSLGEGALRHLVESQAGTLDKAVIECVQNAIDAHATRIDIRIGADRRTVVIEDDGRGFRTREEVEAHFAVFGFDHDTAVERNFGRQLGRFGLGRGQIFAFARTVWESHDHRMTVDLRAGDAALGFELATREGPALEGCRISATLYTPLEHLAACTLAEDITRAVRHVPLPIAIDGKRVNAVREDVAWDAETETLLFREDRGGNNPGVGVYNLGVYVRTYPHHITGCSGTLVSKPGHTFATNMARNDILVEQCALWRAAKALIKSRASARRERARFSWTDSDRAAMLRDLRAGDPNADPYRHSALLKTVTGRTLSIAKAAHWANGKLAVAPTNHCARSTAVHEQHKAVVLAPVTLRWLGAYDADACAAALNRITAHYGAGGTTAFEAACVDALAQDIDTTHTEIPLRKATRTERAALKALAPAVYDTGGSVEQHRRSGTGDGAEHGARERTPHAAFRALKLGASTSALAWTDGAHWIAIDRHYLVSEAERGPDGWLRLIHTLLHECLHDTPSVDAHEHPPEFYSAFHDIVLDNAFGHCGVGLAQRAFRRYCAERKRAGLKITRTHAARLDAVEKSDAAEGQAPANETSP